VVNAALADSKQWRDAGLDVGKLALNFSFRQIEQPDFVGKLIGALKSFDYPGDMCEVEITESALMSDPETTVSKLRQLHSYGVNIAIDDFGTGYSSLSMLQKLPINRLKIDRSFIQDLQADSDRSIIEAIAHMAKGLKLDMVAEGVEQDYQLRYLRKLQCQVVQGFIYSQCLTADAMRKLLEGRAVLTARSGRVLHSV
jgi:EAL domain-containing protein (putative c-di-GMP-specific phosphodiesterase class I)